MTCGTLVCWGRTGHLSYCQCKLTLTMCASAPAHIMANVTTSMGERKREKAHNTTLYAFVDMPAVTVVIISLETTVKNTLSLSVSVMMR